jgi:hypothetical protein
MIRRPRPNEIKLLPQIENEADLRYARVGFGRVIGMPPAWLDQLSVLDRWQRRGHGAAAHALGFDTLYLSTYREVPCNGPYYNAQRLCPPQARRAADRVPPRPSRLASRHHAAECLAFSDPRKPLQVVVYHPYATD